MYRTKIRMARMARKAMLAEPSWHLSSGSEVSMVRTRRFERCCSFFVFTRFSATFGKLNKASGNMLRIVERYIAWGPLKSVNVSIYKRGYGKINKKWQITYWLLNLLLNMASSAWSIWWMRSIPLEKTSKKETVSYGPSNCLPHEGEWRKRPPIL